MSSRSSLLRLSVCLLGLVSTTPACRVARPDTNVRWSVRAPVAIADTIRVRTAGRVLTVPLEEYVLGTALSEVSPVGESADVATRIFAVQAVIARTYAVSHLDRHRADGFDLCDDTHCQLYQPARIQSSVFSAVAAEAVRGTRGRVLAYAGRPAQAMYHADCGGHTAAARVVWGGSVPYLEGTPDDVADETHRAWTFEASTERVRFALNSAPESRVGSKLLSVRVVDRDESGRAASVELRGDETRLLRGERLRAILNQQFGARAVLSSRFAVKADQGTIAFRGTGFGHGVGLCQVGAAARARRGESLEAILSAYFRGAELSEARSGTVAAPAPKVSAPSPVPSAPSPRPFPRPFPSSGPTSAVTIAR